MKKIIFALFLLFIFLYADIAVNFFHSYRAELTTFSLGEKYPKIKLIDVDGNQVDLSSKSGKITIVELAAVNCPASQAFSGAFRYGSYLNLPTQAGLQSFENIFEDYTQGLSFKQDSDAFNFVRILVLNEKDQTASEEDLKKWSEHFKLNNSESIKLVRVDSSDAENYPRGIIPGFQVVNENGEIQSNVFTYQAQTKFYSTFLPSLSKYLDGKGISESETNTFEKYGYYTRTELRKLYETEANRLVRNRDFKSLNARLNEVSKNRNLTSTVGMEIDLFYEKIFNNDSVLVHDRDKFLEFLNSWKEFDSKSEHPLVIEAMAEHSYAWQARSTGYANTVSDEAWKTFDLHIKNLGNLVKEIFEINPTNRQAWILYVKYNLVGTNARSDDFIKIYNDSLEYSPNNMDVAIQVGNALMPQWKGSKSELEKFLKILDDTTAREEVLGIYSKAAFVLGSMHGNRTDMQSFLGFDWNRVKIGFQSLLKKYPNEEFNLQQFIKTSMFFGEFETMCKLIEISPKAWTESKVAVWNKRSYYTNTFKYCKSESIKNLLLEAVLANNRESVKNLLHKGEDVNRINIEGDSPLRAALRSGNSEIAKLLLASGADVEVPNSINSSMLNVAAMFSDPEILSILIEKGADVNATDKRGNNYLHFAAFNNKLENVEFIIEKSKDLLNSRNDSSSTPLLQAAGRGNSEIVSSLIKAGADVSAVDNRGNSALHLASRGGYIKTVELLVSAGVAQETNLDGFTPSDIAKQNGRDELESVLNSK